MTKDNEDALRCADLLKTRNDSPTGFGLGPVCDNAAAHLSRLVEENEDLKADLDSWVDQASQRLKDWDQLRQVNERQSVLLRQALETMEKYLDCVYFSFYVKPYTQTMEALRQHLESKQ